MKTSISHLTNTLFGPLDEEMFYNEFIDSIKTAVIPDCKTVLDVGCGSNSPIKHFKDQLEHSVGVDLFDASINASREQGLHSEYKKMDVRKIGESFDDKSFDCAMVLDVIEHLTPDDGAAMIEQMETIARKKVIIYTPNGFIPQRAYDSNQLQKHLSGWSVKEMESRGYTVTGMTGLKYLRGEESLIKYHPRMLWGKLSALSQPFTHKHPKYAYQILCIKNL